MACRKTALAMACAGQLVDLVVLFMTAGAPDPSGDVDALHRELIKSRDRNRRQVLNTCKYTTAFRREKNPKCLLLHGQAAPQYEAKPFDRLTGQAQGKTPPRRRLASRGMHALEKLLASDAAALTKNVQSLPETKCPGTKSSHCGHAEHDQPHGPVVPKPGADIPFRKQRGRGRFTASSEVGHKPHMVR